MLNLQKKKNHIISMRVLNFRYRPDGHVNGYGDLEFQPPNPIKLQWEIPDEVIFLSRISESYLHNRQCCLGKKNLLLILKL